MHHPPPSLRSLFRRRFCPEIWRQNCGASVGCGCSSSEAVPRGSAGGSGVQSRAGRELSKRARNVFWCETCCCWAVRCLAVGDCIQVPRVGLDVCRHDAAAARRAAADAGAWAGNAVCLPSLKQLKNKTDEWVETSGMQHLVSVTRRRKVGAGELGGACGCNTGTSEASTG